MVPVTHPDDSNISRQHKTRQHRKLPIDAEHNAEGAAQSHNGNKQILRAVVVDLADIHQIIRHPRHKMASLRIIKKTEGQLLNMGDSTQKNGAA